MGILLFLLSLIPVFIILWLFYYFDNEKESLLLLLKLFIGGCLSIILIKILANNFYNFDPDMLYGDNSFIQQFFEKFSLIGVVEEFSKWIIIYLLIWRNKEFNYIYDGIIYSVFVSMGFAVVENFNYLMETNDMMTLISRCLLTVPAHMCFGIIMGCYWGDAKYYKKSKRRYCKYKAFFIPVLLHGMYDYLLSFGNDAFVIFLIYFILLLIVSIYKLIKYLFKWNSEIESDVIYYEKNM